MKTAPMAGPASVPCPLCGEPVPRGMRRCDNCGSVVPDEPLAGVSEFAKSLHVEEDVARKLVEGGYLAPEGGPAIARRAATKKVPPPPPPEPIEAPPPEKVATPPAPARPRPVPARPKIKPAAPAAAPARKAPPAVRRTAKSTTVKSTTVEKARIRPLARPDTVRTRIAALRETAAIGTVVALLAAAAAALAKAAGHEWGQLFLFSVLFGLAAVLTFPDLRPLRANRVSVLLALVGLPMMAAAPVLGSAVTSGVALAAGGGLLGLAVWRLREGLGIYLAWTGGLLSLTILAIAPLALIAPGPLAAAEWGLGGGLALGAGLLVGIRRALRSLADARLTRADETFARKDYAAAVKSYDRAIRITRFAGREAAPAWYGKGAALTSLGKFAEGVEALDRALALNPRSEIAWINKGAALGHMGRMTDALRCYNSALKVNPTYEIAWNNKGNALARLGKEEMALACYQRAIELDPAYRTAWVNRGYVLAKLGRFDEAAECADRALQLTTGTAAA